MNSTFEPACRRMEWLDPFYKEVWEKAYAEGIPISGTFELTPRCNFNCKMCYVHLKEEELSKYGKELSAKEWLRIAKEAKEAGTTWLCITGGEPLMHPEFKEIWEKLSEMGFFLILQTNGSMIRGEIKELLERFPPRLVKITLYGTSDEVYEAVCGVKNGFTRVNNGIHTLMNMGIPVRLVSTIIKQNADEIKKMAFYAYLHHLSWDFTESIKSSKRYEMEDQISAQLTERMKQGWKNNVQKRVLGQKKYSKKENPCHYCRDYRVGYWILWNGMMRFCSFLAKPDIQIKNLPFRTAWKQLLDYEEQLDWPEKCKDCSAFEVCTKCVATVQMPSNEDGEDSYCNIIRSAYDQAIKDSLDD